MGYPVKFRLRRPIRGQTKLLIAVWTCLAVGGAGRYALNGTFERNASEVRPAAPGE